MTQNKQNFISWILIGACLFGITLIFMYALEGMGTQKASQAGYAYPLLGGSESYEATVGTPIEIAVNSDTLKEEYGTLKWVEPRSENNGLTADLQASQDKVVLTATKPGRHYADLFFEKEDFCTVYNICINADV